MCVCVLVHVCLSACTCAFLIGFVCVFVLSGMGFACVYVRERGKKRDKQVEIHK